MVIEIGTEADFDARRARQRATWQYRAVEATRGNQTRLGCILLAVLDKSRERPKYGPMAYCTADGLVMSSFVDRHGVSHFHTVVSSMKDYIANFRGLADALKLNDKDRLAMFAKVKQWISVDARLHKGVDF